MFSSEKNGTLWIGNPEIYCLQMLTWSDRFQTERLLIQNSEQFFVFANDKVFRFGLSQSPNCTFCNKEPESLVHLLSRCKVSSEFWKEVLSWLKENNIVIDSFNEICLFLGNFWRIGRFPFNQSRYAFR